MIKKRSNSKPTSVDMFEVKDKTNLSETEQEAMVELYGYSIPQRPADEQPFVAAARWHTKWGIEPKTIRSLYDKELVERESVENFEWKIRLTSKAFSNMDRKESWRAHLNKVGAISEAATE
jgi:hypothetical protein